MPWDKTRKTEEELLKEYVISYGILTEKIFVTKDVENIAGEAVAVKEQINPNKRIILITSAYYMDSDKELFENKELR